MAQCLQQRIAVAEQKSGVGRYLSPAVIHRQYTVVNAAVKQCSKQTGGTEIRIAETGERIELKRQICRFSIEQCLNMAQQRICRRQGMPAAVRPVKKQPERRR